MSATRTFTTTRAWRYDGYEGGIEDSLILVDGRRIGGAYHCADGTWASYGPAAYSFDHPTREAAEQEQVREYATNPDLYDRINAQARAEEAAETSRRESERDARIAEIDAADRLERLGDDEPGPTVWTLPAYHVLYAPMTEVDAVTAWFTANGIEGVISDREVRVEQRATRRVAVYEEYTPAAALALALGARRSRGATTQTRVVTLAAEPPTITTPARPDLHAVFEQHWPARFPLIDFGANTACGECTHEAAATTVDAMVLWPCPKATAAIGSEVS